MILFALLPIVAAVQEDATAVTLAFERIHCDECKSELEASVKKMPGFKSVSFSGGSAVVLFDEKSAVPVFNRLPKDLSLRSVTLAIRGTVSVAGDKATFVARSGATYSLANGEKDVLAELKKKLGGKNRFQVTGTLAGGQIHLSAFQPADWKD